MRVAVRAGVSGLALFSRLSSRLFGQLFRCVLSAALFVGIAQATIEARAASEVRSVAQAQEQVAEQTKTQDQVPAAEPNGSLALEDGLRRAVGAMLARSGDADEALRDLSRQYPEHNLTHLLMGDRMMARAHRDVLLSRPEALSKWRIAGLRDEAVQRLSYQPPPSASRPTAILNLSPAHRYALMLDASRSRLYLFENKDGEPHLVDSYYASVGKVGMGKRYRGDNKSPVGVYRIEHWRGDRALDELYGAGAYVLDYPNNWDKLQGRTGSGIWVHGTPRALNNRPPLASRGCVVVNNEILEAIREKAGVPSVIVLTPRSYWLPAEDWRLMRDALRARIERWRRDWESGSVDRYLAHYAADYRDDARGYAAMVKTVRRNAERKTWLSVKVKRMDLFVYPDSDAPAKGKSKDKPKDESAKTQSQNTPRRDAKILAVFDQDYRSNNFKVSYRKQQMWREDDGRLLLVYEGRWGK